MIYVFFFSRNRKYLYLYYMNTRYVVFYHMNNIIPITALYLNIPSVYVFASIGFLLIIGLITNDDIIRIHKKLSLQDCGNMIGQCLVEHENQNIERK